VASRKPYIKVVSCKDRKDGKSNLTLDVNEAGRMLLMEAGIEVVLTEAIEKHSKPMSLWQKIQLCWGILK
jgi:hypothetical protein